MSDDDDDLDSTDSMVGESTKKGFIASALDKIRGKQHKNTIKVKSGNFKMGFSKTEISDEEISSYVKILLTNLTMDVIRPYKYDNPLFSSGYVFDGKYDKLSDYMVASKDVIIDFFLHPYMYYYEIKSDGQTFYLKSESNLVQQDDKGKDRPTINVNGKDISYSRYIKVYGHSGGEDYMKNLKKAFSTLKNSVDSIQGASEMARKPHFFIDGLHNLFSQITDESPYTVDDVMDFFGTQAKSVVSADSELAVLDGGVAVRTMKINLEWEFKMFAMGCALLSSTLVIPQSKLFGTSASGLNGTGDTEADFYTQRVVSIQKVLEDFLNFFEIKYTKDLSAIVDANYVELSTRSLMVADQSGAFSPIEIENMKKNLLGNYIVDYTKVSKSTIIKK